MISIQTLSGQFAGILAFISFIPYLVSILRGNTKPSRAGYAIWSVVEVIWASSYIAAGATTTKWVALVFACTAALIFLLSFKYGMGGFAKTDLVCLLLAGVAILLWVTTDDPTLAVYMSTLAALIGYIPVLKKSYYQPKTENTLSWVIYLFAGVFNVLALTSLNPSISIRPLLTLPISLVLAALLVFPKWLR